MTEVEADDTQTASLSLAEFLESVGPSQRRPVHDLLVVRGRHDLSGQHRFLSTPEILLHCTNSRCSGMRYFRFAAGELLVKKQKNIRTFATYRCSNCNDSFKTFSIVIATKSEDDLDGTAYKYGEEPPFGPPTPARLQRMLGDDRELFLKGRRCEIAGLGVGAFTYYRRVVENQKGRIFDEIIRVADKIGASEDVLASLRAAKEENQFSKSVETVKNAIPQALLINGHNPITLLYAALSGGVHEFTDEKCLELAHDARVVLAELSERLSQALKDEAELNTAVSRLLQSRS